MRSRFSSQPRTDFLHNEVPTDQGGCKYIQTNAMGLAANDWNSIAYFSNDQFPGVVWSTRKKGGGIQNVSSDLENWMAFLVAGQRKACISLSQRARGCRNRHQMEIGLLWALLQEFLSIKYLSRYESSLIVSIQIGFLFAQATDDCTSDCWQKLL